MRASSPAPTGRSSLTPVSMDSVAHNPVDHFLTSVARTHGARSACLVLAGMEGDGVAGSLAVSQAGGTLLVLDRATSLHWGFAEPIVRAGAAERVLTVAEAADALRACFTSRDLVRCAEIQIRLGELLDTALAISATRMGHISRSAHGASQLDVVVYRGLGPHFLERFDPIPVAADTAPGRAFKERRRVVVPDVMQEPEYGSRRRMRCSAASAQYMRRPYRPRLRARCTACSPPFSCSRMVSTHEARDMDAVAHDVARLVRLVG